jgi:hypothetical protein
MEQEVRAADPFRFNDKLSDPATSYLSAHGTWRGSDLANRVNTVNILCDAKDKTCEMTQANVVSLRGTPFLSLYNTSYRITKLDARSVVAEPLWDDLCVRQTLTFDRAAKAVTFVRTKINYEEACSLVQNDPVTMFLGEPL